MIISLIMLAILNLIICVSYYRLRSRLKLYYADAYQEHKWRLRAEVSFCFLGNVCCAYSAILQIKRIKGDLGDNPEVAESIVTLADFGGRVLPTIGICLIARLDDLFGCFNIYPEQVSRVSIMQY